MAGLLAFNVAVSTKVGFKKKILFIESNSGSLEF
jgi:hypothetical protein